MNNNISIAWMKEILLLFAMSRLPVNEHIDIALSLSTALEQGIISNEHFDILRQYLYGYTASEIAIYYNKPIMYIEETLKQSITKLSQLTGYQDNKLIEKTFRKKNRVSKMLEFKKFLLAYGYEYNSHTISESISNAT